MSFTSEPHAPRWRDVHLAAGARGISACGDFLAATAIVLALQSRGAGGMAVAAVLLASTVPMVLLAPLAGRIADRVDSRALVVGTGLAQAVAATALAFTAHPVAIVGLVAVLAAGLAVTQPTLGALIPDMVDQENVPRAMAISQTASSLGMLIGPALAGVLVGQFGLRVPLLVDAASYLAIVAAGLMIRTRRGGRVTTARDARAEAAVPWRLRGDTLLTTLILAVTVTIGAVSLVNVVDVFFVRETLHASETTYGLLSAVWTGAMLIGSWLAARAAGRGGDGALSVGMMGLLAGTSAVMLMTAAAPAVPYVVPLWVIGGMFNGGENVVAGVVIARRVPAEVRGRAIGTFLGAVNAAIVVGYLLGGVLLGVLTPRPLLVGAGAAGLLVVAACVTPILRAARRDARATSPAPEPAAAALGG